MKEFEKKDFDFWKERVEKPLRTMQPKKNDGKLDM